jgi:hypothetical protein
MQCITNITVNLDSSDGGEAHSNFGCAFQHDNCTITVVHRAASALIWTWHYVSMKFLEHAISPLLFMAGKQRLMRWNAALSITAIWLSQSLSEMSSTGFISNHPAMKMINACYFRQKKCETDMIWYDIYLLTLHISMLCASNQRSGWSSLVVTQPSTDHQLMCVQCVRVRVCVCTALSNIYYSGPSW